MRIINTFLDTTSGFGNITLGGAGELEGVEKSETLFIIITNIVFQIGLALGLLFIIVGGVKMVTSAGDPQKFAEGRQTIMWAIIGLIVVIGYKVILSIIFKLLTG